MTDVTEELRTLANKCAEVHYLTLQGAYLATYPGNGAFRNHLVMGCGATAEEACTDYRQKFDAKLYVMDGAQKRETLKRLKLTRAYEKLCAAA